MNLLSEMRRLVAQCDSVNEAASDLWTWLPSHKQAEACLGDYAFNVQPGADWIMREACSFIAHKCSPTDEQLTQEPYYQCPCDGMCPKAPADPEPPQVKAPVGSIPAFNKGSQVIEAYGQPLQGIRKTTVQIRPVSGDKEILIHEGSPVVAVRGVDYVMLPTDGADPYPCKIDIFNKSWEIVPDSSAEETSLRICSSEVYRRTAPTKVVQVPEGETVLLCTLEGIQVVSHPNYIAIGVEDEVYPRTKEWVDTNLDFLGFDLKDGGTSKVEPKEP